MIVAFLAISVVIVLTKPFLRQKGVDVVVLQAANVLMYLVSLVAFLMTRPAIDSTNTHRFIRAVYTGFIVKFFVVVIAAFIYFQLVNKVNTPALILSMLLYFVYTYIEVSSLLRLMKGKKNA